MKPHARVRPSGFSTAFFFASFFARLLTPFPAPFPAIMFAPALLPTWDARAAYAASGTLRYAEFPRVTSRADGTAEWTAALDCAPPVDPVSLLGAYVAFARDDDLDGTTDAADTTWVSPADCGEAEPGRIRLRRRFAGPSSMLRTSLYARADTVPSESHAAVTGGIGSLLAIARYCARPKNGEPEWIAMTNRGSRTVSLSRVRLEGRTLGHAGVLDPGATLVAGADTAELALWQPGARRVALSSWGSLRNTGDTLRLVFEMPPVAGKTSMLVLDSVIYGAAGFDGEACASLAAEGSGAAAAGFELVFPAARARMPTGDSRADFVIEVRANGAGLYDLFLHDLDGFPVCALARGGSGSADYRLAPEICPGLRGRAGTFILHLRPRGAPGVRKTVRIAP